MNYLTRSTPKRPVVPSFDVSNHLQYSIYRFSIAGTANLISPNSSKKWPLPVSLGSEPVSLICITLSGADVGFQGDSIDRVKINFTKSAIKLWQASKHLTCLCCLIICASVLCIWSKLNSRKDARCRETGKWFNFVNIRRLWKHKAEDHNLLCHRDKISFGKV